MTNKSNGLLLSTAYFPPVQYFALIRNFPDLLMENQENYIKQSYRNRCNILSANGILPLIIPVKRIKGEKTPISKVKPDNSYNWQRQHRISIESAYRSAPFYEFYIDDIIHLLELRHDYLIELNSAILKKMLNILNIPANFRYTEKYHKDPPPGFRDIRDSIHPKKRDNESVIIAGHTRYNQVFRERSDFVPGLSILDVLFNAGPDAGLLIAKASGYITSPDHPVINDR